MSHVPAVVTTLTEITALGRVFKASGYFRDIRDEAQAVTKILYGRELGFAPIISMMGIYIIDGKLALSANLMASLIKLSGKYNYRVLANTDTECSIAFLERRDDGKFEEIGRSSFTMEDAKRAAVTAKDVWRKYPGAMLFARALSAGMRTHCPDAAICPVYSAEELGAEVTETGEVVQSTTEGKVYEKPPATNRAEATPAKTPESQETPAPSHAPDGAASDGGALSGNEAPPALTPEETIPPKYISSKQAGNLAIRFRESLRPEIPSISAEELRHDFLRINGFIDADGNPSALMIPLARFAEVGKSAVAYASSL